MRPNLRMSRNRISSIQPNPSELADVAISKFAPVGQSEDDVNVPILGGTGRYHEQLAGHLEMDRQHSRLGVGRGRPEPDQELLAAPAHSFDLTPLHCLGKAIRRVAPERLRPIRPRADDPRARHQAAQVPGDRLDFG